jgi:hypothetical protein
MKMWMIVTFLIALVVLGAFLLVVINRESEKIVTAAIPLAVAALVAIVLIFVYAREEPMTRVFPVRFCYQIADKLPVTIPDRPFPVWSLVLVDRIRKQDSKVLEEPTDGQGTRIYHEFLLKTLVEWMTMRYPVTWRMENLQFEIGGSEELFQPAVDAKEEISKVLSVEELQRSFGQNRFARVHTGIGTLAVPPGTYLHIDNPDPKPNYAPGRVLFKNKFCEISIRTSPTMGMRSLGPYSMLLGIGPPAEGDYWTQQYTVRITATFSPFLAGHPQMRFIKGWATGILDGLQNALDEQVIWRKTVESYMLRQHLPPSMRSRTIPFGPVRDQ